MSIRGWLYCIRSEHQNEHVHFPLSHYPHAACNSCLLPEVNIMRFIEARLNSQHETRQRHEIPGSTKTVTANLSYKSTALRLLRFCSDRSSCLRAFVVTTPSPAQSGSVRLTFFIGVHEDVFSAAFGRNYAVARFYKHVTSGVSIASGRGKNLVVGTAF